MTTVLQFFDNNISKNPDLPHWGPMLFSKVNLFFSGINTIVGLLSFSNKFLNIFEHINCPLSVLFLEPRKLMSEDQQGVLLVSAIICVMMTEKQTIDGCQKDLLLKFFFALAHCVSYSLKLLPWKITFLGLYSKTRLAVTLQK